MKDYLLNDKSKKKIVKAIAEKNFAEIISILEKIKTSHAETAKTKDKQFVIREIIRHVIDTKKNPKKEFLTIGSYFCREKEPVAKQIGISLVWRAYGIEKESVKELLLRIADDQNWEVREYAANAFANTLHSNKDFYETVMAWTKHPSENVRRAVVFSALGCMDKENLEKGFAILEALLYDESRYVKKNLGPFIIGSYYANRFPKETLSKLNKWRKIRDENVRWNVIMAFNNSFGSKHPEEALKILEKLAGDTNLPVRRALISTLNFLSKKHPELISKFKEKYLKDDNLSSS